MITKFKAINIKIIITVRHLFKRLIKSPLLLGWIIIGIIIEFVRNGFKGLVITIINLVLLALFATIIKIMTDNSPKPVSEFEHPRLELLSGVTIFELNPIIALFLFEDSKYSSRSYLAYI